MTPSPVETLDVKVMAPTVSNRVVLLVLLLRELLNELDSENSLDIEPLADLDRAKFDAASRSLADSCVRNSARFDESAM